MALTAGIRKLLLSSVSWCWTNSELHDFLTADVSMLSSLYRRLMPSYRSSSSSSTAFLLMDLERLTTRNWYPEGRKPCFVRCWPIISLHWMKVWLLIWKHNEFVPKRCLQKAFFLKKDFFPSILKIILNNFSKFFHLNQIKRTNWEIWFLTSATCWTMLMMENQLGVICSSSRLTMDSTRLMGLKTASWWFPKQWKIFRIIILRCWEGVRWLSPSSSLG